MTDSVQKGPLEVRLRQKATHGWRVMGRAAGVMSARLRHARKSRGTARVPVPFNAMFDTRRLSALEPERAPLEQFDLYLFDVMTRPGCAGRSCSSTARCFARSIVGAAFACSMSAPDAARSPRG